MVSGWYYYPAHWYYSHVRSAWDWRRKRLGPNLLRTFATLAAGAYRTKPATAKPDRPKHFRCILINAQ